MVFENTSFWPSKEGDQLKCPPPTSSYGFQKLAVEYFARAAWDQYKVPYTILRIFNAVGIGESRAFNAKEILSGDIKLAMSHVVPDLIQKILKGQDPLRILGDGYQVRHLTYGGDLAKGIALSLENPNALNNDFNISTKDSLTILELAEMIWKRIKGNEIEFRYICEKPFEYDVQKRIPDINKAYQELGFKSETKIDKVLDEVIPWVASAIDQGII
jgi:nucleoside-diphosphate-sugar epimerase